MLDDELPILYSFTLWFFVYAVDKMPGVWQGHHCLNVDGLVLRSTITSQQLLRYVRDRGKQKIYDSTTSSGQKTTSGW